jgi:hypothetical protein
MPLEFKAPLPTDIPPKARVHRLGLPNVTPRSLAATAKRLRLSGRDPEILEASDRLSYREGRWQLDVHRVSGAIAFTNIDRYGLDTGKPCEVTDEQAARIARRFLAGTKLVSIKDARLLRVTHLRGADANPEQRTVTERILDAGVVFGRVVDGLAVTGPGGNAMIHIDAEAEVVGARAIWRPLSRALAKVEIKPVEHAVRELERITARLRGDTTVVKAEFGYFELGALDRQTVLEPVYAFVYVVRDGEVASKHAHVVHAGGRAYAKLIGPKRFTAPRQRTRKK